MKSRREVSFRRSRQSVLDGRPSSGHADRDRQPGGREVAGGEPPSDTERSRTSRTGWSGAVGRGTPAVRQSLLWAVASCSWHRTGRTERRATRASFAASSARHPRRAPTHPAEREICAPAVDPRPSRPGPTRAPACSRPPRPPSMPSRSPSSARSSATGAASARAGRRRAREPRLEAGRVADLAEVLPGPQRRVVHGILGLGPIAGEDEGGQMIGGVELRLRQACERNLTFPRGSRAIQGRHVPRLPRRDDVHRARHDCRARRRVQSGRERWCRGTPESSTPTLRGEPSPARTEARAAPDRRTRLRRR